MRCHWQCVRSQPETWLKRSVKCARSFKWICGATSSVEVTPHIPGTRSTADSGAPSGAASVAKAEVYHRSLRAYAKGLRRNNFYTIDQNDAEVMHKLFKLFVAGS